MRVSADEIGRISGMLLQMIALFPSRTVALALGPLDIHWYGILYLLGFLIGMRLLPRLIEYRGVSLTEKQRESLLLHVFLGVLLGGRLGYVLFYGLAFYAQHPAQIFAVWQGGMSSHGGFVGVALMLLRFARRNRISLLSLTDILVVPVAIGLSLGRLGNLINGELYGTLTTVPWGMHFPGVEGLRHPTQVYAMFKDVLIALICFVHLRRSSAQQAGADAVSVSTTALFLMMYAILRFTIESLRDQPFGYSMILGFSLSRGQLLTIPLFVLGMGIWLWRSSLRERS